MKVSFTLHVPAIHPVSGRHTWHDATIICANLDLTPEQVFKIVSDLVHIEPSIGRSLYVRVGSVAMITDLAMTLQAMTTGSSVLIVWESSGYNDLPVKPDLMIFVNYSNGRIEIVPADKGDFMFGGEFNFRDIVSGDKDNRDKFIAACYPERNILQFPG